MWSQSRWRILNQDYQLIEGRTRHIREREVQQVMKATLSVLRAREAILGIRGSEYIVPGAGDRDANEAIRPHCWHNGETFFGN